MREMIAQYLPCYQTPTAVFLSPPVSNDSKQSSNSMTEKWSTMSADPPRTERLRTGDACRRASKTASQRRWLNKAENRDYFCGPDQIARVQRWRVQHPGYARRGARKENALQDDSSSQIIDKHKETATLIPSALQDILATQPLVLIGLIAHLSDITLQEDIVFQAHRLHLQDSAAVACFYWLLDILNQEQGAQRAQTSTSPGTATPGT